jgi:hypothetical protein
MRHKGAFVRINPREFNVPNEGDIAIPLGALEALQKLAERL